MNRDKLMALFGQMLDEMAVPDLGTIAPTLGTPPPADPVTLDPNQTLPPIADIVFDDPKSLRVTWYGDGYVNLALVGPEPFSASMGYRLVPVGDKEWQVLLGSPLLFGTYAVRVTDPVTYQTSPWHTLVVP